MNWSQAFSQTLTACRYFWPSAELASDRPDDRTQLLAMPDVSVHNMVLQRCPIGTPRRERTTRSA
jgi:hypothetical protein